MGNILIIGVNSQLAQELSKNYKKNSNNVFGISSNPLESNYDSYVNIYNYNEAISDMDFSEVVIIGSRMPSQGGTVDDFVRDNLRIVDKAISVGGQSRYIFISSFDVYDQSQSIINLKSKFTTDNPYGISKLICEKYLTDILGSRLLIMRVPVLLCPGVQNNFMAKLKYQISIGGTFNFSNVDRKVNTFFTSDDYFKVISEIEFGIINCCTKIDWTIEDLIKFSMNKGLSHFNIISSKKPPQVVEYELNFINTSQALMNFING